MNSMLRAILDNQRSKVEARKRLVPVAALGEAPPPRARHRFRDALQTPGSTRVIAEIKRASPSAGLLRSDFDPVAIACSYAQNGAAAISVLTEEDFFLGSLDHLRAVRESVSVPVLRKDFIIDAYQLYETRAAGAAAVLLIVAVLDPRQLCDFLQTANALGLDALVEAHTRDEVARALDARARIIGINNRDLHTFSVTLQTSLDLVKDIPSEVVKVSESGIHSAEDIARLRRAGFNAFLVGEQLMRAPDPGQMLRNLTMNAE